MTTNPKAPSPWKDTVMNLVYTLTPTHCGIGQAASSVDLPIARDVVTGFPIMPATALKGVAREAFEHDEKYEQDKTFQKLVQALFGPDLDTQEDQANKTSDLYAAGLAFTEGRLIAYPVRSLNRPFLHVTCPLIMDNLARDGRLLGQCELPVPKLPDQKEKVYLADPSLAGKALVIEDLGYNAEEVLHNKELADFAQALARLFPESEQEAARRLADGLVILPDTEFSDLIQRAIPVVARTQLTGGKTADKWVNPETGDQETGNLWYEEYIPADTLFISFTGQRRQVYLHNTDGDNKHLVEAPLKDFSQFWENVPFVQIGGNETVGQGLCLWKIIPGKGAE